MISLSASRLAVWFLALWASFAQAGNPIVTPHVRAELLSEQTSIRPGQSFWMAVRLNIIPGWHTYWKNPGDSGEAMRLRWELPPGWQSGDIHWPWPERLPVGPLMNFGYAGVAWMLVPITPPPELASAPQRLEVQAKWLVCEEECIPESGTLALSLPVSTQTPQPSAEAPAIAEVRHRLPQPLDGIELEVVDAGSLRLHLGRLNSQEKLQSAWFFPEQYGLVELAASQILADGPQGQTLTLQRGDLRGQPLEGLSGTLVVSWKSGEGEVSQGFDIHASPNRVPTDTSLVLALLFALAGGLLLNVMPCVFPVLSLKALHLVEQRRVEARGARLGGLVFTAGILISFLAIAAVLLLLRSGGEAIGWGFQLQSPPVVLALAWLTFALGLWLSGVWTLGHRLSGVGQGLTESRGHLGSFFTGVLAVVVATPCTAPFMGAALGYALTQPAPLALAVFLALGLGMALPWLLLSFFPALQRRLPRPGPWLEHFKQLLAFPLYATAAWLVWVLSQQTDAQGLAAALAGLVAISLAAWLWPLSRLASRPWRWFGNAVGLATFLLLGGLLGSLSNSDAATAEPSPDPDQVFSQARLNELRAQGKPVFVNFTAAWCITCQVNDRLALSRAAAQQAMREGGVTYLKADWTRRDPAITAILERHGRSGVPMYLLYPPGSGDPEILPAVLTEALVLERLRRWLPAKS